MGLICKNNFRGFRGKNHSRAGLFEDLRYTSTLRLLIITVNVPKTDSCPLIYFEKLSIASTTCKTNGTITQESFTTGHSTPYIINGNFANLLFDVTVTGHVFKNSKIQAGSPFATKFYLSVSFLKEYLHTEERMLYLTRNVVPRASLVLHEEILDRRTFSVGENVTHNESTSFASAYKLTVRVTVSQYLTMVDAIGKNTPIGGVDVSPSQHSLQIMLSELVFGDSRSSLFVMRLESVPRLIQKKRSVHQGEIILDKIYYRPCKDCLNENGTSNEKVSL